MKVLVCHNSYQKTSGEDLVIQSDLRILRDHGIDVIEYFRSNDEITTYSAIEKVGFFLNAFYSWRSVREVKTVCSMHRPDVALVQNVFPLLSPSVYHALHAVAVPIVQLVYNYRFICPNAILYTKGRICERCVHGNFMHAVVHKCYRDSRTLSALYAGTLAWHRHLGRLDKLISAYVTPDRFLQDKLADGGFPRERMFCISNPFDITSYSPCYEHQGYFVYFGRIVREKGIFTALSAMRAIPDAQLIVVGGGEAEVEARRVVEQLRLTQVDFRGPTYGAALVEILRGARAVVVPTEWYDNSPLVVHQAFALGKPVIASSIDGIPEIVHHEINGLLFTPGDATELAQAMRRLMANESFRESLARNARAKAEKEFTASIRFEQLMTAMKYAIEHRVNS